MFILYRYMCFEMIGWLHVYYIAVHNRGPRAMSGREIHADLDENHCETTARTRDLTKYMRPHPHEYARRDGGCESGHAPDLLEGGRTLPRGALGHRSDDAALKVTEVPEDVNVCVCRGGRGGGVIGSPLGQLG